MRLIDADKLIRTVRFLTLRDGKEIEIHYVKVERIDSAPTIDAVPVTRCKDCKWYGDGYLCYNTETLGMQPYDYCSLAERREK